jgi:hypothetical protein
MKLDRGSQSTLLPANLPLFERLGGAVASLSNPPSPTG